MRAVVCRAFGGPDEARVESLPAPPMVAGGVRIAVHASAASFASLLVMQGRHQNRAEPPFTPGTEIAGVVTEVGPGVDRFRPGDRVVAAVRSGGYADEAVAPQQTVFALPDAIGFATGACFPSIYGTVFAGLAWRARVRADDTVLVHGAGGASGLAAVGVARAMGARVIACAGGDDKLAAAREQGADALVDHRLDPVAGRVLALTGGRGVDVVVDPVGGDAFRASLGCLAPDGRLVSLGFAGGVIPTVPANLLLVKNVTLIGLYWGHYLGWGRQGVDAATTARVREAFAQLFAWTLAGRLRPRIDRTWPLEGFAEALARIASREAVGRVVLLPRG